MYIYIYIYTYAYILQQNKDLSKHKVRRKNVVPNVVYNLMSIKVDVYNVYNYEIELHNHQK